MTTHIGQFQPDGSVLRPFQPAKPLSLGSETYVVGRDLAGLYLAPSQQLPCPPRVYGKRHDVRIMEMYQLQATRGVSTGVWLDGEKGSGKTMLAGVLSDHARKLGLPTILVQSPFFGPTFNSLVAHVGQACWIFDEFEKTYAEDEQKDAMLTLFAGGVVAKNLYILTTNKGDDVHNAMMNRPGRMRYLIRYNGVSEDVARDYVSEHLEDKAAADKVVDVLKQIPRCNFDILKEVVSEHNRFGGDVEELLSIMNVERRRGARWNVHITATYKVSNDDGKEEEITYTGTAESGYDFTGIFYDGHVDHNYVSAILKARKGGAITAMFEVSNDVKFMANPDGTVTVEPTSDEREGPRHSLQKAVLRFERKYGFTGYDHRF